MILNIPTRVLKAVTEVCGRTFYSECAIEFTKGRYRIIASDKIRLFIWEGKHEFTEFPDFVTFYGSAITFSVKDLKDEYTPVKIEDGKMTIRVLKIKDGETSVETHEIRLNSLPSYILAYRKVFPAVPSETVPMLSEEVWRTIRRIKKLFKDEPIQYISFGERSQFLISIGRNCYLVVMPLRMDLTCNPEEWAKELAAIKEEF